MTLNKVKMFLRMIFLVERVLSPAIELSAPLSMRTWTSAEERPTSGGASMRRNPMDSSVSVIVSGFSFTVVLSFVSHVDYRAL